MNEELQTHMLEYMSSLERGIKSAGDFAVDQIPLVVQEYVSWYFWDSVMFALCGLIISLVFITYGITLNKYVNNNREETTDDDATFIKAIAGLCYVVALLFFIFMTGGNTRHAVKAEVSPRVIVIEWVADHINTKNKQGGHK